MRIRVLDRPAEAVQTTWDGVTKDRRRQWCAMEIDGLVTNFQVTCDPGKELEPGDYVLCMSSFNVVNGRLQLTRPVLIPARKSGGAVKPA